PSQASSGTGHAMPSPADTDRPARANTAQQGGRSWTVGEPRTPASNTSQSAAAHHSPARTPRTTHSLAGRTQRTEEGLANVDIDASSRRVTVSLNYVGGLLAVVALTGAMGVAFATGRMTAPVTEMPLASTPVEEIDPNVMDVTGFSRDRPETDNPSASAVRTTTPTKSAALANLKPETRTVLSQQPPIGQAGPRVVGLHYVLVQSYAKSERDKANAAVEKLRAEGIGATIETGITGWPNRLCVFGTRPFERVRSNADYDQYKQAILNVAQKYKAEKLITRFAPMAVKWRQKK
ncbi:MAG: hypothetical protein AAGK78_13375, partial [Planctomycetota bacterium]